MSAGAECRHPTSSVRWDPHNAVLRCRACGRVLGDAANEPAPASKPEQLEPEPEANDA